MQEYVTMIPISNEYFWTTFQGPPEEWEKKFDLNYSYCYGKDANNREVWWLYYRDIGGNFEKAARIYWADDEENPAYS